MDQGKPLMAANSPLVDFDAVCQKVRAAVEPARTHAVSLHDEQGEVLWLSESSMGPDEHNAVREAAESFANPGAEPVMAFDLGDSRSAVMIRAVNARRVMVGVVMIIMDTRILAQGAARLVTPKLQRALLLFAGMRTGVAASGGAEDANEAPAALEDSQSPTRPPGSGAARRPAAATATIAASAPASAAAAAAAKTKPRTAAPPTVQTKPARPAPAPAPMSITRASMPFSAGPRSISGQVPQIVTRAAPRAVRPPPVVPVAAPSNASATSAGSAPSAAPAPAEHASPSRGAPAHTTPAPAAAVRSVERQSGRNAVTPEIDRLHAALRKSPIALHVQRLVPLSKGGQLKRYEVLLRSGSDESPNAAPHAMLKAAVENGLGSMIDRRVLSELISWLIRHPESCQANEVMFSVNLTSTALHDEHFIKFVELCLSKSSLPKATIAFEVDASTALKLPDKVGEVAMALQQLGCPLILDDFALRTECFELLRLPGVRYVKLAPEMTAKMRTDKVSQASITGVVQMARVLGMHTVAKRTETAAEQEWLTALGVDFVQSNAMSPPVGIDSLSKPARD
jgi:EAL domain-containing protein (putative c-di-GMP-specific phosphodiesterase class I)